jgi:hypothetical protein
MTSGYRHTVFSWCVLQEAYDTRPLADENPVTGHQVFDEVPSAKP